MKRVSCKMFFAVIWKGICQALAWFFGLFGYKKEGRFAKILWYTFAVSVTVIVAFVAVGTAVQLCKKAYKEYQCKHGKGYSWEEYLSENISLRNYDESVDVIDSRTGKIILEGLEWTYEPIGYEDSLMVYCIGDKRGYFSMNTGMVILEPRYTHAWVFSDGIAAVEENGIVKFIDCTGKQIMKRTFAYNPDHGGYVFHHGYCRIDSDGDRKYGLMNLKGETVMEEVYDDISIDEDGFTVTMSDNTMMRYDMSGNLISDFCVSDCSHMEYESVDGEYVQAELLQYTAGNDMCGLLSPDGEVLTLPKYKYIIAIDNGIYQCAFSYESYELLNSQGRKIK